MNDTKKSQTQYPAWLLFIPQLPPKPDYLRVKLRRGVQRIGAVSLRNAVYVLPNREETTEDFAWLRSNLKDDDADAIICTANTVAGVSDAEIIKLFNDARDEEYNALIQEAEAAGTSGRLQRRLEEIRKMDFFNAPAAVAAVAALHSTKKTSAQLKKSQYAKRTWVTRTGVFVDRIASAWLIRRFIDRRATFKFVPSKGYVPKKGELRFDMYEGEFGHEGSHCTFETLVERFGLGSDPALRTIAEIVHDIDVKDSLFDRAETAGVELVISGIAASNPRDGDRISAGSAIFDGLYERLK